MILKNGYTVNENFELVKADVAISGERISKIGENLSGDDIRDMSGKYILPGFVDTHVHGGAGQKSGEKGADYGIFTEFEATQGVTSIAVTTSSSELSVLEETFREIKKASENRKGAKICGIHAEGPFINKKYKGAMIEENIIPFDIKKLDLLKEASGGLLKIITIAPENEGAEDFIKHCVSNGITVSLGHTDSDFETTLKAFFCGATRITHTFNAMRPLNHREPGILGAALTVPTVKCELICDYVHLHPATIKMVYNIKGADNIIMVSDTGKSAGLDVTEFESDGQMRYIKDGVVRLADGTIAGSARSLRYGVKNLAKDGIPLSDIAKMASKNPAESIGIYEETGSLKAGKLADIVVLDEEFEVVETYINGKRV